jgi:hypothetical protein
MMDQPSALELVTAVREFIEKHALPQLQGHLAFHARVAVNALAIVGRELEQGEHSKSQELGRLKQILRADGALEDLNRELCRRLRSDAIPFDQPDLVDHLKQTTLAKVVIDQPTYSGYVHSPHRIQN